MKILHDKIDIGVEVSTEKIIPFEYLDGSKKYLGLMVQEISKVIESLQITSSDAQASDFFGISVALDGTRLVVGANAEDTSGTNAGKVYVYEWNPTTLVYDEITTLTASDAQATDRFGESVALSDTRLVVGAYAEDTAAADAGKVYVYEFDSTTLVYNEIATLTASDAQASDLFGASVALDGTRLVVGAYAEDTTAADAGKVYVYEFSDFDEYGFTTIYTDKGYMDTKGINTRTIVTDIELV